MIDLAIYGCVALLVIGLPALYWKRRKVATTRASTRMEATAHAGLTEPVSLHPVIDPIKCIGCATCVGACPEGEILGVVNGKAKLVEPSKCIGHGACKSACPMDAIELVFGTATRGVDIPHVKPNFESNVDGLYIAGELGGMGLIRNAVTQGRQAMEQIAASLKASGNTEFDVVIVGSGPAGIAASLQAVKSGLRYVTVDQAPSLGGTLLHFPRQKLVMTQPMEIPLYGPYKRREISKEEILELFEKIVQETQLDLRLGEKVESIQREGSGFAVRTSNAQYRASRVLLAIGRRGTPRRLGVPGEDRPKVAYALLEPEQYAYKHLLVVGGGDSAVEAALSLSEAPGTTVTLSYRKSVFARIKERNRLRLEEAARLGRMAIELETEVEQIDDAEVQLNSTSGPRRLQNDFVFVFAGGEPPTAFLNAAGVRVETKYGTA